MEFTGERYIPEVGGEIRLEHFNRYYFVLNQLNLSDKVVVDLASGEGYGTSILSSQAKKVYGIDISKNSINHAKFKYQKENLEFLVGEAVNIPLKDMIADVFVSFETIEHIEDHLGFLNEIKRVLKPDGILIISTPNKQFYSELSKNQNIFHIKELYYSEFKDLISRYFRHSIFFKQSTFVGSLIFIDENGYNCNQPIVVNINGKSEVFPQIYNIAIASNQDILSINHSMVAYTENDLMITKEDLKLEHQRGEEKILGSTSYKVGYKILLPLKRILRIVMKQTLRC